MFTCSILLNLQKVLLRVTSDLLKELLFRSCTVRQIHHHREKAATDSLFGVTSWLWMSYDSLVERTSSKMSEQTYWRLLSLPITHYISTTNSDT
jgi:hypothetical protein